MDNAMIFDIGCNNGDDTDFYLRKGFKVVAVDADKSMCDAVSQRFSEEIKKGDCEVIYGAFSDSDQAENVRFFVCDALPARSSCDPYFVEINRRKGLTYREVVVPRISMKEIISKHGIPYYLKIDIEGMDMVPLRALASEKEMPAYISVENPNHDLGLALEQILELKKMGYKRYHLSSHGMLRQMKAPMPAREGAYAEFRPTPLMSGLFGNEICGEWVPFHRAVEGLAKLYRLHILFRDNRWFSKNGQFGIIGKMYNRYRRHVLGAPVTGYDLHARLD